MMVSKRITLLAHMAILKKDIRECQRQATDQNSRAKFNIFFHQAHHDERRVVTTAERGGYTETVQNIYGVPPLPTEEQNEAIDHIITILQGMQIHSHDL